VTFNPVIGTPSCRIVTTTDATSPLGMTGRPCVTLWTTRAAVGRFPQSRSGTRPTSSRRTRLPQVRIDITVRERDGSHRDVAISTPGPATFAEIAPQLSSASASPGLPAFWSGEQRIKPDAKLGSAGLQTGATVHVGRPGDRDLTTATVLQLHVVGGPDAGRITALSRGVLTVGRSPDCGLVLTDPDVSRLHAAITTDYTGVRIRDLSSTIGTSIDATPVGSEAVTLHPGQLVRIGDSFLRIAPFDEPPAATRPTSDGRVAINRPPRTGSASAAGVVEIPQPPAAGIRARMQWIAALSPLAVGGVLAILMHSAQLLLFAVLSPVAALATSASARWHARRTDRQSAGAFDQRAETALATVTAGLRAETQARRHAGPDAAAVGAIATVPGARLWERRRDGAEVLSVRLGLSDVESRLCARRGTTVSPAGVLAAVPTCVDLRTGPLGIAAPPVVGLGIARWLVGQLCVLCSPHDVEIAAVLAAEAVHAWHWLRWLPHVRGRIATTRREARQLTAALSDLAERRRTAGSRGGGPWAGPWTVVVVDDVGALDDVSGLGALLAAGPEVGITAVCLAPSEQHLPAPCATTARAVGETGSTLAVARAGDPERVLAVADRVSLQWADRMARAIAPFVDSRADGSDAVPDSCRLLELLGSDALDPAAIQGRWTGAQRRSGSSSTVIGMAATGPVTIDLVRDGPHMLVAGTTGSGKSELLQSLVAGLAASNPTDRVSILLVDYKGGAAFADCARLPHVVGLVTDLDQHLTTRALQSLDCELRRREAHFARVGAHDIDAYWATERADRSIPRLVLVVDEFAALAQEQPGFLSGLISIAQRGRSLGVHLVLATQRPGGVVSPEIRANATLRIALRVADQADSTDVIGTPDAAYIDSDSPGRAIVRCATSLTTFQVARVAGSAPSRRTSVQVLDDWRRVRRAGPEDPSTDGGATDLRRLVDSITEAATLSRRPIARRPWLTPLPARLHHASLPACGRPAVVALGLLDLPTMQRQEPVTVDLEAGGALLLAGTARSGRTSALLTLARVSARQLEPAELHLYVIDCGGGGLGALSGLHHCGSATTAREFGVVAALLRRLEQSMRQRRDRLLALGVDCVREARNAGHDFPLQLCVLDGWEGFVALAEDADLGVSVERFLRILRGAPSTGLTVAVTGDRTTLAPRLAAAVETKYLLRLADRSDYALAAIPARAVPEAMPPGRCLRASDGAEAQIAWADVAAPLADAPPTAGRGSSGSAPCPRTSRCPTSTTATSSRSVSAVTTPPRSRSTCSARHPDC